MSTVFDCSIADDTGGRLEFCLHFVAVESISDELTFLECSAVDHAGSIELHDSRLLSETTAV